MVKSTQSPTLYSSGLLLFLFPLFSLQTTLLFYTFSSFLFQIPCVNLIYCLPWTVILLYLSAPYCYMQTLPLLTNLAIAPDDNQWIFSSIVLVLDLFFLSDCLFVDGKLLTIWYQSPNIWFNSLIISTTNCVSLSVIILSGNLCNFQMLTQNNFVTSSAKVFSIVDTKCTIFVILLYTTRITLYPYTSGNFVIKSTIIWLQGFSSIV